VAAVLIISIFGQQTEVNIIIQQLTTPTIPPSTTYIPNPSR